MSSKYNKIMEWFWLVVAIATAVYAGYKWNQDPSILSENTFLFFMPFIAAGLWAMRRYVRRKQEARQSQAPEE
jgi:hypothetical protein